MKCKERCQKKVCALWCLQCDCLCIFVSAGIEIEDGEVCKIASETHL